MPTCHLHPNRETGRSCTRCGRPACPDCLIDAPVGAHCLSCVKAAQPSTRETMRRQARALRRDSMLATKVLIGLNVVIHLLSMGGNGSALRGNRLAADWALWGFAVQDGEWYRLLTAGFLHYGIFHLLLNMFALYQLGQFFEDQIGWQRYVGIYLVSVLAGSAGALLIQPQSSLTAGASGGVFGLAGAATLALTMRGVRFSATGWGPMLLINLLITFGIPGISVGGHLGGLAGGVAAGYLTVRPRRKVSLQLDLAVLGGLIVALVAAGVLIANARFSSFGGL